MKEAVSLLIDDGRGKVLLQLRDDKESIPFPNTWSTFGGEVEPGETPLAGIRREIKEELDLDILDPEFVGKNNYGYGDVYLFRLVDENMDPDALTVLEGQRAELFTKREVENLSIAFNLNKMVLDYFAKYYPE